VSEGGRASIAGTGAASALTTGRMSWSACGYPRKAQRRWLREWGTDHQPRDGASLNPPASLLRVRPL